MEPDISELKKKNTVAYNKPLRDQLEAIHQMLGTDVTDIANSAMQYSIRFNPDAEETLSKMSKLASDLSVLLLEVKSQKKELNEEEKHDYDAMKKIADILGNLQFEINQIVKISKKFKDIAADLLEKGTALGMSIINAQEVFRNVRIDINALGFLSQNKEIAYLFERNEG